MLKVLQEKTTAPSPGTTLSSPYQDDNDYDHDHDDDNDDDEDDDDDDDGDDHDDNCYDEYDDADYDDENGHQDKGVGHLQALLIPCKAEPAIQLTFTSITIELPFS